MRNKEEQDAKVDQDKGKLKKAGGDLTHDEEPDRAGDADLPQRSEDERASPTRLPGIPGHGMTSNTFEDED